jgi:PAS domain S-box-containing protein
MSEFKNDREKRIKGLIGLFHSILYKDDPVGAIKNAGQLLSQTIPSDVIVVVDELVREGIPMAELKTGINKFLNQLHKQISSFPSLEPAPGSFTDICFRNNAELDKRLKSLRPDVKRINADPGDPELKMRIRSALEDLLQFEKYYIIKENVLFPVLENHWPNFRCLGVMWSFHDDIRRDIRTLISMTSAREFDIRQFNRIIGNVYFNMYAIKFREEAILFPYAQETLPDGLLDSLLPQCAEIGFPYMDVSPVMPAVERKNADLPLTGDFDLVTGTLSIDQVRLIFNHLPVDITYVDEHNKVRYFSTPPKRIFPRTKAVIGRDVRNCHPPESVHIVEEIVEAFRSGKENKASFWIRIKEEMILIQYFAVRDEAGNYKGVIEVSQEITEIRALEGERRLVQWGDGGKMVDMQ